MLQKRRQIVSICKQLYKKGLIVSNEGNVSARLNSNQILITPARKRKGFLSPKDLVLVDLRKKKVSAQTSSEFPIHHEIYSSRSDVQSVIHAHPPFVVACSLAGISLKDPFLAEIYVAFGKIPTISYTTPSTRALAKKVRGVIKGSAAIVLERHGAVTVGKSLEEAFDRMEQLEQVAKIAYLAKLIGRLPRLSKKELKALEMIQKKL